MRARRSGLNPAGWHRYVPIAVVVAVIVIALAALGYAGGGVDLSAMFKSAELAHAGTELVEGAQAQTGVAPQRGIVAAAATIADAQKGEDTDSEVSETSANGAGSPGHARNIRPISHRTITPSRCLGPMSEQKSSNVVSYRTH